MTISRRSVVASSTASVAGLGVALAPAPAHAAYVPRAWARTAVPSAGVLHGLQRFTAGYTPDLLRQVTSSGGFERWFELQLAGRFDDSWYDKTSRWWPSINASVADLWKWQKDGSQPFLRSDGNYQCWTMVRRLGSQLQVRETMADFWEHHLHVPASGEAPFRASYGKAIRNLALESFEQLLLTAVTHPAMAAYLGNANSSKVAPNENLGRELLELHTVGIGNYDEDDVKASARILTGYRMGYWTDWSFSYDPRHHWTGPVRVMGFRHANSAADGRPALVAFLRYLARHPATAERIAFKLARRFVADEPPAELVAALAQVYLQNDTQIRPVLRALVASPYFARAAGQKVRTPAEDVVASYRALGVTLTKAPETSYDATAANAMLWQSHAIGQTPLAWPRPDGRPDVARAWSSTSRFLASLETHYSLAGGWYPYLGAAYRSPSSWLPAARLRFDELVDHLSRTILGRPSTSLLLQVACEATGCTTAESITRTHRIVRWEMPRLLTVFLDSPAHMNR